MMKNNVKVAFIVLAASSAMLAHAQTTSSLRPAYAYPSSQVSGMQLGDSPLYANPNLGLALGRDTNMFLTPSNEKASTLYTLSPGAKVDARMPEAAFQASYQGQYTRYAQSRDDDFNDHIAKAQIDSNFAEHAYFRLGYNYLRNHDPRGSTDRGVAGAPDKYRINSPYAIFAYGAPGAEGRIELFATDATRKYLNNRATTFLSDREQKEYGGAFYWRAMPKTYLMAEARGNKIDYDSSTVKFGGKERRYYIGATWEATAATTGTLKIGRMTRDFNSGLASVSGPSWEADVTWKPLSYSSLNLSTSRQTVESTGVGNVIFSGSTALTWDHSWTDFINSSVLASYRKDDFQGFNRNDKTTSLGFKLGYKMRKWLAFGAEYTHTSRSTNAAGLDYDKNLYMLTATITP